MSEWNNGPEERIQTISTALMSSDWINPTSNFRHTKVKEDRKTNSLSPFDTFRTGRCPTSTKHLE